MKIIKEKMWRWLLAITASGILSIFAVAIAAAHDDHSSGQWPTSCVDLNDIVEEHLGHTGNVGIYQRAFGDQAEVACRNDHRDDVRYVFAWALGDTPPQIVTGVVQIEDLLTAFNDNPVQAQSTYFREGIVIEGRVSYISRYGLFLRRASYEFESYDSVDCDAITDAPWLGAVQTETRIQVTGDLQFDRYNDLELLNCRPAS